MSVDYFLLVALFCLFRDELERLIEGDSRALPFEESEKCHEEVKHSGWDLELLFVDLLEDIDEKHKSKTRSADRDRLH